jgi:hypothetical protein
MGDRLSRFAADVIDSPFEWTALSADAPARERDGAAAMRPAIPEQPPVSQRSIAPTLRPGLTRQRPTASQPLGAHDARPLTPDGINAPSIERRLWPQAFSCGQHADLDCEQLREIGVFAAFAEFPYQLDLERLFDAIECADPEQRGVWKRLDSNLAKAIATEAGLTYDGRGFSDGNGGMKAYIFVDETHHKATLVFGGTTSTSVGGGSYNLRRLLWGVRDQFNQWWANFQSVFGSQTPESFTDAANLLRVAREKLSDYEWWACGHSKGGAEAAFAAAMNSIFTSKVRAICFCSPPFGASLMNRLSVAYPTPRQLRRYATEHIRHINVEGDPVPALDRVVNAAHIGTAYTLPPTQLSAPWVVQSVVGYLVFLYGVCLHVDFKEQVTRFISTAIQERSAETESTAMEQ